MFSVIVAVFNGEKEIANCLRALQSQSVSRDDYEVVVVDDGSTDRTQEIVRRFDVHLIAQQNKGPAAARNAGVRAAKGEIVLFTDADCEASPEWIEEMVAPFEDLQVAGTRGLYKTRQRDLVARFCQFEYETKYERLRKNPCIDYVDTSAAAYRRSLLDNEGPFREVYRTAYGEDTDLSFRLTKAGHRLVLSPRAFVYHHHPTDLRGYLKRKYNGAIWRWLLYSHHPDKIVTDSHTPQTLKLQIGLFYAVAGSTVLSPFGGLPLLWVSCAGFLLACLPFVTFTMRRDPILAIASPWLLFLRSGAFGIGLVVGGMRFLGSDGEFRKNRSSAG